MPIDWLYYWSKEEDRKFNDKEDDEMRPLTDEEFCDFNEHVKCNWLTCQSGVGLAGHGCCSSNGEWDNPECPLFEEIEDDE